MQKVKKHASITIIILLVVSLLSSSFCQEQRSIEVDAFSLLLKKCETSLKMEDPDSIQLYFNLLTEYKLEYGSYGEDQRLPSFFLKAGEMMAKEKIKKETIKYFIESSDLYKSIFGVSTVFYIVPILNLADFLFDIKDFDNAISYYNISANWESSDNHTLWLYSKNQLGLCYSRLEEYETARNIFLEIQHKQVDGKSRDSISIGLNKLNIAMTFEGARNHSEALRFYLLALTYFNFEDSYNLLDIAFIYNNIGNVYLDMRDYLLAASFYQKALSIRKRYSKPESIEIAQSYSNIGYCHHKLGNPNLAIAYCDSSIASNIVGYKVNETSDYFNNVECISQQDLLLSLLDKSEYEMTDYFDEYGKITRNAFNPLNSLKSAEELFYGYYSKISSYRSKIAWSKYNERLYKLFVSYYGSKNDPTSFYSLIAYGDKKRNFNHRNFEAFNNSEIKNKEFSSLMNDRSQEIFDTKKDTKTNDSYDSSNSHFYDTLVFPIVKTNLSNIGIDQIQQKLNSKVSIVAYSIADSSLFIQIITSDTIIIIPKVISDLKSIVTKHINSIKTYSDYTHSGTSLYNILWMEPAQYIMGSKNVIIIPDEYLFHLPFETLKAEKSEPHLIEKINISYSFSFSSLLKGNSSQVENINYYGFSPIGENSSKNITKDNFTTSSYLKFTDEEVMTSARILAQSKGKSSIYLAEDATISNLQKIKDPIGICHISTHAIIDKHNPWKSYLQMYPDSLFKNGRLLQTGAYSLNLQAKLIVLNACETGFGEINTTEGSLSLGRAFSSNRINNLILSLWKVDDQLSFDIIKQFFINYVEKQNISESLGGIKRKMIAGSLNHPFFWAGHVHYNNSL